MENQFTPRPQDSSGNRPMPQSKGRIPLFPLFLGIVLALVLLAIGTVNAMTTKRLEARLEQLEKRVEQLEQTSVEPTAATGTEAAASDKSKALPEEESGIRSVAHRGFSAEAPENTLPAFLLAWRRGFRYVETDIQFTADGIPVCLHDQWIDRTSNGKGRIDQMTLEQVREYDFGSWMAEGYAGAEIPTFEEFLKLCRILGLRPYIELKAETVTQDRVPTLVEMVKALGMENQVSWISFSFALLETVRDCDETARLGYLVRNLGYNEITAAVLLRNGQNSVFLDSSVYSEAACWLCRENGLTLEVWTLDSTEQILALDPYISGVTSNLLIAEEVFANAAD